MNLLVLLAIVAGLIGLRFLRPHILVWLAAWWIAMYVGLRFGIEPPLPSSIVSMFMAIITLALVLYVTAGAEHMTAAREVIVAFLTERRYTVSLVVVLVALPVLVAVQVYVDVTRAPQPPVSGRTIHPPPPTSITFRGQAIDLVTADNPYRALEASDPEQFAAHVANGRRVYYENCLYCHGDNLAGEGHFAHGFDPIPADFQDAGTIAQLQESYLFWRIAKGGPGLPQEATPWSSAMPAWEDLLTEEEIWDVILFMYDFTGHRPRAREGHE